MLLAIGVSAIFLISAMRRADMVPGRMQGMAEMMYEFVAEMVRSNVGSERPPLFPIHFYAFCVSAVWQYAWPYPLFLHLYLANHCDICHGRLCFCWRNRDCAVQARPAFLQLFVPAGAPKVLIPFLIVIEVISYFVRPVSLSVRLFANMLAGHTMLKVFAGLAVMISGAGGLAMAGSLLPFLALIGLTGLEVLVAALQAYVFTILTCMYLNDALHLH